MKGKKIMLILQVVYFVLIIFVIYRVFKRKAFREDSHMSHKTKKQSSGEEITAIRDPKCGMYISANEAVIKKINGKVYYFCSENCALEFEKATGIS
jgi:YHS domain-containing protein